LAQAQGNLTKLRWLSSIAPNMFSWFTASADEPERAPSPSPAKENAEKTETARAGEVGSPGSTCAGSTPLDGPSPAVTKPALPEYDYPATAGLPDYDYPATVFVKNTFIDGPPNINASLMEFMPPREAKSCPASAIGAPPGLGLSGIGPEAIEAAVAKEAKEQAAVQNITSVSDATPTVAVSHPTAWPRTMSGDALDKLTGSPEMAPVRPVQWPRTMSGDALAELAAAADAVTPERCGGKSPEVGVTPSPVRPMAWPRTMSGDALGELMQSSEVAHPQHSSPGMIASPPAQWAPAHSQHSSPGLMSPPPAEWAPHLQETLSFPPPPMAPAVGLPQENLYCMPPAWSPTEAPVLRLSEVIPEPALGSPECPTQGSRNHRMNNCKPCAFLHTKGCSNGLGCEFCHLCEPGEKKRRQREKRQIQRLGPALGYGPMA